MMLSKHSLSLSPKLFLTEFARKKTSLRKRERERKKID
jgi:hypothetical protein